MVGGKGITQCLEDKLCVPEGSAGQLRRICQLVFVMWMQAGAFVVGGSFGPMHVPASG